MAAFGARIDEAEAAVAAERQLREHSLREAARGAEAGAPSIPASIEVTSRCDEPRSRHEPARAQVHLGKRFRTADLERKYRALLPRPAGAPAISASIEVTSAARIPRSRRETTRAQARLDRSYD